MMPLPRRLARRVVPLLLSLFLAQRAQAGVPVLVAPWLVPTLSAAGLVAVGWLVEHVRESLSQAHAKPHPKPHGSGGSMPREAPVDVFGQCLSCGVSPPDAEAATGADKSSAGKALLPGADARPGAGGGPQVEQPDAAQRDAGKQPEATRLILEMQRSLGLRELLARVRVSGPGEVRLEQIELASLGSVQWLADPLGVGAAERLCRPGSVVSRTQPCVFVLSLSQVPLVGSDNPVRVTGMHDGDMLQAQARAYVYQASFVHGSYGGFRHYGVHGVIEDAAMMLFDGRRMRLRAIPGMRAGGQVSGLYLSKDGRHLYARRRAVTLQGGSTVGEWTGEGTSLVMSSNRAFNLYPTRRGLCAAFEDSPLEPSPAFRCYEPGLTGRDLPTIDFGLPMWFVSGSLDLLWIRSIQCSLMPAELHYFSDRWRELSLPRGHDFSRIRPQAQGHAMVETLDGTTHYAFFADLRDAAGGSYPVALLTIPARGSWQSVERFGAFDLDGLNQPMNIYGTIVEGLQTMSMYVIANDRQPAPGRLRDHFLFQSALFDSWSFDLLRKSRSELHHSLQHGGSALTSMVGTSNADNTVDYLVLFGASGGMGSRASVVRVDRRVGLEPHVESHRLFSFIGLTWATRFVPMISDVPYPE